eukprot:762510-Hanusia_phi.AAC.9
MEGSARKAAAGKEETSHAELFAMSPLQEFFNAVTMLFPTIALSHYAINWPHPFVVLLLLGTVSHLPVSFTYHMSVAFSRYDDRLDNDMRRLDQSMQHVLGAIFSYALSGSFAYMLLNLIYNVYAIILLWDPQTSNDGKRWFPVMISVLMYNAPMAWRSDYENFMIAFFSMGLGGMSFIPWLNKRFFSGWGHSIFHVALFLYARALAQSASKIAI